MTGHTVRHLITTSVCAFVIAYSFMIHLYKYDWEPLLKEVNQQGVLILKVFYVAMVIILGIATYLTVRSKTKFRFAYMALLIVVCMRLGIVLCI